MATLLLELKSLTRLVSANANAQHDSPAGSPTHTLIDDVSLQIASGQRLGLSGASGSGKSTLLRCIVMLDPFQSGRLYFRGKALTSVEIPAFRRQVIYLHQRPALFAGTVRENLQFPFTVESSQGTYNEDRIATWLQTLSRPIALLDQDIDTLSGGEQQLVALLRAIQLDPIVLLLDEPTASLDADSAEKYEQLVNLWFETSSKTSPPPALVWISHDMVQLDRMTDRKVLIEAGSLA